MKLFFDTEFTGLHKDTTLISIGIVSEDGKSFYAEFTDYKKQQCDDWIKKNVIANLKYFSDRWYYESESKVRVKDDKSTIGMCLMNWLSQFDTIEFVSDVCHYDFVLLIDLFGTAWNLPKNVAPVCHDINQDIARYYNISQKEAFDMSREEILEAHKEPIFGDKHNALYDAEVIEKIYNIVNKNPWCRLYKGTADWSSNDRKEGQ